MSVIDTSQLSPSLQVALRRNPDFAALPRVFTPDLPHHTSDAAREALYVDPFADVPAAPPPRPLTLSAPPVDPPMHGELKTALVEYTIDERIAAGVHVAATALWSQSLASIDAPDAVTNALIRIDKLEEREKRYRMATGMSREIRRKRVAFRNGQEMRTYRMPVELTIAIKEAQSTRGDRSASDTVRFLIECGLILMDERARRYEVAMLQELRAADPAIVQRDIEIDRYLKRDRPGFKHSILAVDPLVGAPPSVRALLARAS